MGNGERDSNSDAEREAQGVGWGMECGMGRGKWYGMGIGTRTQNVGMMWNGVWMREGRGVQDGDRARDGEWDGEGGRGMKIGMGMGHRMHGTGCKMGNGTETMTQDMWHLMGSRMGMRKRTGT